MKIVIPIHFSKLIASVFFSFLLFANTAQVKAQYCPATHGSACNANSTINDVVITGTTLSNTATGCTSGTSQAYTIYAPSANTTATLILGQSYTLSVTTAGTLSISAWIDYDHNLVFDASEWTLVSASSTGGVASTVSITIPLTAIGGPTGLRIRSRAVGSPNGATDACTQYFSGESEDYTITLDPGVACSGTPVAGTTAASDTTVCPGVNFTLTLAGSTIASGLTYQWESSLDNITWGPISGATFITYQTQQTVNTYYRCIVSCAGNNSTSVSLLVLSNTFVNCYCSSGPTATTGADIGNVTLSSLNNGNAVPAVSNPASTSTYSDFTSLQPVSLTQGISYPLSVSQINDGATTTTCFTTLYIDFNQNGVFDAVDETYVIGQTSAALGNVIAGSITIPYTAMTGTTRMRIVLRAAGSATQSACGTFGNGETEDYLVTILAGTPCIAPPSAGTTVSSTPAGCFGTTALLSLNGNSVGSGQTYQWQSSPDNITWTSIPGAINSTYLATINASTYYQCILTCNSLSATSTSVQVQLNPATICYCTANLGGAVCPSNDFIRNVTIAGTTLNNSDTICTYVNTSVLSVFPPLGSATATLSRGSSYSLSVTTSANNIISVWIDYDQNGIYDANEWNQVCTTSVANTATTINVDIPWGIPGGLTGMRIRSRAFNNTNNGTSACLNFGSGETEDYQVTIDIGNGINTALTSNLLSIEPNPANELVKVNFTNVTAEDAKLKLFGIDGKQILDEVIAKTETRFSKTIDVRNFPKGIYFIQLIGSSSLITKKLVIE
ncbi:MAG TPA: GEVED domain-containing protein [Bacteroidia bacterium]|nr:GEVED domain-containing protein [Bacteroidia bacterium]HRH09771.1 GEVED domain-containing protein [Bacteroidia bacterium]